MNKTFIVVLLLFVNRFEKFFDRWMCNYPDGTYFKIVLLNWNSFNLTCKNKGAIFIHSINFTVDMLLKITSFYEEML